MTSLPVANVPFCLDDSQAFPKLEKIKEQKLQTHPSDKNTTEKMADIDKPNALPTTALELPSQIQITDLTPSVREGLHQENLTNLNKAMDDGLHQENQTNLNKAMDADDSKEGVDTNESLHEPNNFAPLLDLNPFFKDGQPLNASFFDDRQQLGTSQGGFNPFLEQTPSLQIPTYTSSFPINLETAQLFDHSEEQREEEDLNTHPSTPFFADAAQAAAVHQEGSAFIEKTTKAHLDLGSDLSPEAQKCFTDQLQSHIASRAGFQTSFALHNKLYRNEQQNFLTQPELVTQFETVRSEQQQQYRSLDDEATKSAAVYKERVKKLSEEIARAKLEIRLSDGSVKGNDSYLASMDISFFDWSTMRLKYPTLGYKYGAQHRLSEINQALAIRKGGIGIKEGEEIQPIEGEKVAIQIAEENPLLPDTIRLLTEIAPLSGESDKLKESVVLFNESMKLEDRQEMNSSDFPKKYYLRDNKRLAELVGQMSLLVDRKENAIKELDRAIDREQAVGTTSSLYLDAQQKRDELIQRWDKIMSRCQEVETLLGQAKSFFGFDLSPTEMEAKDEMPHLSKQCLAFLDLLNRIVVVKENLILEQSWESHFPDEKRREIFSKTIAQVKKLEEQKLDFEKNVLPNHTAQLQEAIATHKLWLRTMASFNEELERLFGLLKNDAKERSEWKLSPASKV